MPKGTTGSGIMVSAFVSRETGFGLELSDNQLRRVNDYRALADNNKYSSLEGVCKKVEKKLLLKAHL